MSDETQKQHVSIVICGHVDSGKSTTTGRLLYELGGINEREMEKLRKEAEILGKSSFAFAFYMDRCEEERKRGITIQCTTKEFFTDKLHYTVIDAPGHTDFIRNMISGASQADVGLLMVPADAGFGVAIQKGDHKNNEIQGQTRQHARLLNLLGVKHLIVGINKIDSAGYKEERYNEIRDEMKNVLQRVGWRKDFVEKNVAFLPISGWVGDNLIKKSDNMPWWNGQDIEVNGEKCHIITLLDALNNIQKPERKFDVPLRAAVSGVYNIKGVGTVVTARLEQGVVKPGDEVVFLPKNTSSNPCGGKIFSIEMHHKSISQAEPGDNVGLNVKGLDKNYLPEAGDIMILKKDTTLKACKEFTVQAQVLEHPNELKVGYCPLAYVRTARSACKLKKIVWKMGKETGGQKITDAVSLKSGDVCELVFEPLHPFVVEKFTDTEGLGRVALFEGNQVQMIGKVISYSS